MSENGRIGEKDLRGKLSIGDEPTADGHHVTRLRGPQRVAQALSLCPAHGPEGDEHAAGEVSRVGGQEAE